MRKLLTSLVAIFVAASVLAAPSITVQPTTKTNLVGTTNTFSLTATGNNLRYQWYFAPYTYLVTGNGFGRTSVLTNQAFQRINQATNNTLTVTAMGQNWGLFYASVTNSTGITNSKTVSLVMTNLPPPTNTTITLWWTNKPNTLSYEVWSTTDITRPMTLYTNVGLSTNLVMVFRKGDTSFLNRFFEVKANQGNNTKSVTLAWDASPDASVNGYKLYVGPASGTYTNTVPIGRTTTGTVSNLRIGNRYFFTVTAVNGVDPESGYSNEIAYTIPGPAMITNVAPAYVNISVVQ